MYRIRRGMGDVLNPTSGTALDCGLFNLGVFNKACWCLSFPSLCSKADYQAATILARPENIAPIQQPPVVGAPAGDSPAASSIDTLLADQMTAWQAQNAGTIAQTQANLDRIGQQYDQATSGGVPWYWWLIGGLGVFGMVAFAGGSPRRYGR